MGTIKQCRLAAIAVALVLCSACDVRDGAGISDGELPDGVRTFCIDGYAYAGWRGSGIAQMWEIGPNGTPLPMRCPKGKTKTMEPSR